MLLFALGPLASAATPPDLTVWTTYQGPALAWLKGEASSYQDAFGKSVEVVARKLGEIKQGAMTEAPKGNAADVFVGVPQDQFSALADAGILADVGSFATPRYLADLSEQAQRAFRYRGTLYGLPLSVQGPALIVNTDLVPHVPATYPDLVALATSLTGDGRYGFAFDIGNFYYSYAWLHTFGGSVFGRTAAGAVDPSKVELGGAGAVAGARALKALRFGDALVPEKSDYASVRTLFLDGKLAMTYDGPWAIPAIRAAGIPVAVAPMPPLADGTAFRGFMNVDGVLLNHYSTDPVAAANLAKWLTTAGAQAALARTAGMVPASKAALARVADSPVLAGFGAALADAQAIPNAPAMGAVWGPMDRALTTILASQDSDVAAALQRAATAIAAAGSP
jgi:arabinogalactan oligomer/maltooligosaccharide transport system substrate-binding protein